MGAAAAPAQPQRTAPAATAPAPVYAAPRAAGTKPGGGLFIGAGLVMSNLTLDSETQSAWDQFGIKKKMKMGFQFGVGYEMALSRNISIMPGLFYSTAGANFDYTVENKSYTDSYSFSGLMIPIDVKISFNGPFVTVGPYIGYLFSGKYIPSEGESTDLFKADDSGNVYWNRLHFGVSLGAGIVLDLGGMGLMVKAGYQLGLSKINKPFDSTDTSSLKHNAIIILAAIRI
ncbi:MAG: porin family protein [Candidatus Aminicenantes bacterium]|nr:porin family protein [Candidatus Aminicenantes bacterium]